MAPQSVEMRLESLEQPVLFEEYAGRMKVVGEAGARKRTTRDPGKKSGA